MSRRTDPQHGLTAADVAENVETLDRLRLARSEQPAEGGRFARETALGQSRFELRKPVDDRLLAGVAFNLSGGDAHRVLHRDGGRHEREGDRTLQEGDGIAALPRRSQAELRSGPCARDQPLFDRGTVDCRNLPAPSQPAAPQAPRSRERRMRWSGRGRHLSRRFQRPWSPPTQPGRLRR